MEHASPVHSSFAADTEASFCESQSSQRQSIVARSDEEDLDRMTERLTVEEANLAKWRMKLRKCSICLKVIAILFMACSAFHLLFPVDLEKMMMHGKHHRQHDRDPRHSRERKHPGRNEPRDFNNWLDDEEVDEDNHRHHGRHLEHDNDFFVVVKQQESRRSKTFDSADSEDEDEPHHRNGGKRGEGHRNGNKHGDGHRNSEKRGDGHKMNKKHLAERRIGRLMTRATFLSFLMWTFVLFAACIGHRVSKFQENTRWIRCTFKKALIMLLIASGLGLWKLNVNRHIMKEMHRFHKQMERQENSGMHKNQWKPERKHHRQQEQMDDDFDQFFNQVFAQINEQQERQESFSSHGGRHLGAATEGRRLRSSFDVFDFVNNAIDSGVKKAHHNQHKAISGVGTTLLKDVKKVVAEVEHELGHDKTSPKADKEVAPIAEKTPEKTHVVQMAEPVAEPTPELD